MECATWSFNDNALVLWAGDDDEEYLRTGDLGIVQAGNLFITSRLKDLVSCLNPGRERYLL